MAAFGAKRTFGDRCLNRYNYEPCARSVPACCTTGRYVPDPVPAIRGNSEKYMPALSSSRFDLNLALTSVPFFAACTLASQVI
jgi:hypothetical protein